MKPFDLKCMPEEELWAEREKLRLEAFELRFKAVTEPIANPAELRRKRRQIAVINTVLREKEIDKEQAARAAGTAAPKPGTKLTKADRKKRGPKLNRERRKLKREAAHRAALARAERRRHLQELERETEQRAAGAGAERKES